MTTTLTKKPTELSECLGRIASLRVSLAKHAERIASDTKALIKEVHSGVVILCKAYNCERREAIGMLADTIDVTRNTVSTWYKMHELVTRYRIGDVKDYAAVRALASAAPASLPEASVRMLAELAKNDNATGATIRAEIRRLTPISPRLSATAGRALNVDSVKKELMSLAEDMADRSGKSITISAFVDGELFVSVKSDK